MSLIRRASAPARSCGGSRDGDRKEARSQRNPTGWECGRGGGWSLAGSHDGEIGERWQAKHVGEPIDERFGQRGALDAAKTIARELIRNQG